MKKFIVFTMLLLITMQVQAYTPDDYVRGRTYFGSGNKRLDPMYLHMEDAANGFGQRGTGSVFYVDSNVSNEGDGTSWTRAKDTLDEAINLCAASNGDIIYVAQGHAESGSAAGLWDADVAGITIRGIGNGALAPSFTFADTDTTVVLGAANIKVENLRFLAGISAVVVGVSVEAAADNCTIVGCDFPEPSTSTFEFVRAVLLATGADNFSFNYNTYSNADATGATNVVDIDTGVVNGFSAIGNRIIGEFAEGAIHSDQVALENFVWGNDIQNITTGQHAIEFTAAATGTCAFNTMYTDAAATTLDPGSMKCFENYNVDVINESAYLVPVVGDNVGNYIGVGSANDDAVTTSTASNADGSILERLEYIQAQAAYFQPKGIKKTATSQTDDLFDVDGGAIEILSFQGHVTTQIGAVGNIISIVLDADPFFINSDFSTAVETNADIVGTRYLFSNAIESVLTPVSDTTGNTNLMESWFCGEGMIEQLSTGSTTGVIVWYMVYRPLETGVTVTAQ